MDDILSEIPDHPIEGERVVLRLLAVPDAEKLFFLINESREFLSRHLPWPHECTSVEDVESRIDTWQMQAEMGNGACWGIFEKTPRGNILAGVILLGWIQAAHLSASVSYWLGENFTGRGLATEALRLLSDYAFARIGLHRLELSASVTNEKSIAVARRAGFREEGKSRDFERINGFFEDHLRFARLADDP